MSHLLQIGAITRTTANKIAESLYANDYKKLQKAIAEYTDKSIGFYDAGAEGFYHGLVLGLIALMDNQYKINSNRESGDGRYDAEMKEKYYDQAVACVKDYVLPAQLELYQSCEGDLDKIYGEAMNGTR